MSLREEGQCKYPDTQGSTNLLWHLYLTHPKCFDECPLAHDDLDEMKIFRENVLQLPKVKIAKIVTTIQTVLILLTFVI